MSVIDALLAELERDPDALRRLDAMLDAVRPAIATFATESALTVAAAARRHAVSERTIRRAIADGRLSAKRIGRSVRLDADDVDRLATRPRPTVPRIAARQRATTTTTARDALRVA